MTDTDPIVPREQARRDYLMGVHRMTVFRWIKSGRLPAPIRITKKTTGWRRSVLEAFVRSLEQEGR